jgi:NAD+ diphosphatase
MPDFYVEMRFCRRCGAALEHQGGAAYQCHNGHAIFLNPTAAVGLVLLNDQDEVLLLERAVDPGKGMLDIPGGFCEGPENAEAAISREILEETGLAETDYTKPEYVTSHVDPYKFKDEILPVCGLMYTARLTSDKQPKAADDAATVKWVKLYDIDVSKVYFPSVRKALELIIQRSYPGRN